MSLGATNLPLLPSRIGKRGTGREPSGRWFHWEVLDEVRRTQSDLPSKVLCLERIKFDEDDRIELRLGYYIIGKKPRMRGKWVWGQYATMMPIEDFKHLVDAAESRGWF